MKTDSLTQRTDWWLPEGYGVGGMGEKGEGLVKYKVAVTKQSWGCEVQHGEYSH